MILGSSQFSCHGGEVQLRISHLKSILTNKLFGGFSGVCGSQPISARRRIAVAATTALLIVSAVSLIGCGGGNSSSNSITVTITPTTATLSASQTTSFTAAVAGTSNTAVTWSVNGTLGGNDTYGTISASGLYTAPATVTTTVTETITATSEADTTKTATASVTLTPNGTATSQYVTVSPSSVILPSGGQQTFAASVNSAPVAVTWQISCKAAFSTDCGTINSSGVYNAPLAPPPGGTVTVSATTTNNSANPGFATISIQYSNASLDGQFAFAFSGESGTVPIAAVGTISMDGTGVITGGSEDIANGGVSTTTITGGSYHLGTDGRGTATIQTSTGTSTWQFVVESHNRLFAVTSDTTSGTMGGALDLQDPTQFSINAITGNYAFVLSSPVPSAALAQVGAITADGAGNITSGTQDVNSSAGPQVALAVTGSYIAPSSTTGRGTLTLTSSFGTQTFTYYMVNGTTLKLLEQSAARASSGEMTSQPIGPFSVANVKGRFATALLGSNASGPATLGAQLSLDGAGAVTGTADSNLNGNILNNVALTGTYSIASTDTTTGRTQLTLTGGGKTYTFVAYPAANQDLYLEETDTTIAAGTAYAQTTFVVNGASLGGSFATSLSGISFVNGSGFEAGSGQLVLNGGSAVTGTLDLNLNNVLAPSTAVSGSYLVDQTGRVTMSVGTASSLFSTSTLVIYPIDQTHFLFVEADSNRVLTGLAEGQF